MAARTGAGAGWSLAVLSSACFSTSGSFATPLIHSGWSSGAAVAVRIGVAGLVLVAPAAWSLRGQWVALRRNLGLVLAYGLIAVAGGQVFYFNALSTLTVGVALLLEYLGMLMVVVWLWLRHHQRPRRLTIAGTGLAIAGLALVLDVFGGDVHVDPVGVLWGLAAAVGLAMYFVLSSRTGSALPPLALACSGLLVGAAGLLLLGVVRALPMHAATRGVELAGHEFPWWVPILGLSVIAAAVAYVAGIAGVRILGPKLGSFVSLFEVMFAVLFAWLLLGQLPALVQLTGGVLIVAGVALVRLDEARGAGTQAQGISSAPSADPAPSANPPLATDPAPFTGPPPFTGPAPIDGGAAAGDGTPEPDGPFAGPPAHSGSTSTHYAGDAPAGSIMPATPASNS